MKFQLGHFQELRLSNIIRKGKIHSSFILHFHLNLKVLPNCVIVSFLQLNSGRIIMFFSQNEILLSMEFSCFGFVGFLVVDFCLVLIEFSFFCLLNGFFVLIGLLDWEDFGSFIRKNRSFQDKLFILKSCFFLIFIFGKGNLKIIIIICYFLRTSEFSYLEILKFILISFGLSYCFLNCFASYLIAVVGFIMFIFLSRKSLVFKISFVNNSMNLIAYFLFCCFVYQGIGLKNIIIVNIVAGFGLELTFFLCSFRIVL